MTLEASGASLRAYYSQAKHAVLDAGYGDEIAWQATRRPEELDESTFLREAAWVILNTGFRESVVRRHFSYISLCFCDWESSKAVLETEDMCVQTAMQVFRHERKLRAIVGVCRTVAEMTFAEMLCCLLDDALGVIGRMPYFGPVTSYHLAKNVGFDVAKPDRHLVRIARRFGDHDVQRFCTKIAGVAGDPVRVVDVVLWRYAAMGEPKRTMDR